MNSHESTKPRKPARPGLLASLGTFRRVNSECSRKEVRRGLPQWTQASAFSSTSRPQNLQYITTAFDLAVNHFCYVQDTTAVSRKLPSECGKIGLCGGVLRFDLKNP